MVTLFYSDIQRLHIPQTRIPTLTERNPKQVTTDVSRLTTIRVSFRCLRGEWNRLDNRSSSEEHFFLISSMVERPSGTSLVQFQHEDMLSRPILSPALLINIVILPHCERNTYISKQHTGHPIQGGLRLGRRIAAFCSYLPSPSEGGLEQG